MSFEFPGESVENLTVEVTWGAIVLEDFNYTASLTDFRVFDDLIFEIWRADFLYMGCLLYLLTLIEMLEFTIKEFLYQLIQVLSNLVEENNFSVLVDIWIRVVLFALLSPFFIPLCDQRLSRFECFTLFRVDYGNIWEYFRELFGIEKLRSFLLIPSIIYIKCLSIILKNLFELPDISRHI